MRIPRFREPGVIIVVMAPELHAVRVLGVVEEAHSWDTCHQHRNWLGVWSDLFLQAASGVLTFGPPIAF